MKFVNSKFLFLLLCAGFVIKLHSQTTFCSSIRIIPSISVGYTFGVGINVGGHMGVSVLDYQINQFPCYSGLEVSYTVFTQRSMTYESGYFIVKAMNLMNVVNNQLITKIGLSNTCLKWGMEHRNTNKPKGWGWGLNTELALAPLENFPYLGFRFFMPRNACLGLNNGNPKFIYAGYQYPFTVYHDASKSAERKPKNNMLGF
jgi:hypothetical protein